MDVIEVGAGNGWMEELHCEITAAVDLEHK
jgi:hypothetical protein